MTATLDMIRRTETPPRVDTRRVGLHGHSFDAHALLVAGAEALGTFVLVLSIIAAAIAATLAKLVAGGVALTILVAPLGGVSGAHFTPAVTLSLAATRRFPWSRVPLYVVAP